MKVNIMPIRGEWDDGYVLDYHTVKSVPCGYNDFGHPEFDTVRTEIGEAIYQLKYNGDLTKIEPLAEVFVEKLGSKFKTASLIIPIPPSKERKIQPILELNKQLAVKMGIFLFENILMKKYETPQMKNINKKERSKVLMRSFSINDAIAESQCVDVLMIDDLYDSGTSLLAATRTLRTYPKINKVFVAAFSRTR
jgi:predicted amidophosphoribosyltransferase